MLGREIAGIDRIGTELERTSSAGLAFTMICMDPSRNGENATQPKIWTNIEKKNKPATGRIAGQISFPGESRKIGKSMKDTIAGGLFGEFSGDTVLIDNIFFTPSWYAPNKIQVEGKPFDLAVLIFRGSLNQTVNPLDINEVAPNGWMTVEEIQRKDPQRDPRIVRPFVHQVIALEILEGHITKAILEYEKTHFKQISVVLPEGSAKNPKQFLENREKLRDIVI